MLKTRIYFYEEEVTFVLSLFTSIKQRVCLRLHALQAHVLRWIKPQTTSLVLGTFADLTRGKAELLAENARLAATTHHLASTSQATGIQKDGSAVSGALGQNGEDLETSALPRSTRDASLLAS